MAALKEYSKIHVTVNISLKPRIGKDLEFTYSHNVTKVTIFWNRLTVFMLGLVFGISVAAPAPIALDSHKPLLAILDPVNLNNQGIDTVWGERLHSYFQNNRLWTLIPRDSMLSKFRDFKVDAKSPCHEFQCAFDNGNILGAEYILFGSVTNYGDLFAYTFNLVHVPTSQVVWSQVGDVPKKQKGQPELGLEATLAQMAAYLVPGQAQTDRRDKHGQLTVLDLSQEGSPASRIMSERVATHLYASRSFDIMGSKEMEELLSALGVNKHEFQPNDSSIFSLGGKMDVTHLVYSKLQESRTGNYQLQLALYDVAAKKKIREWPAKSTEDFHKLMEYENRFFTSLFKLPGNAFEPASGSIGAKKWTLAGAGVSVVLSATLGYLAYAATLEADRNYKRFQDARSLESAKKFHSVVLAKERGSVIFGVLSGLCLVGAGTFLVYSF